MLALPTIFTFIFSDTKACDDAREADDMPPLFDVLTDQVLPHGCFDNAHSCTQVRADAASTDDENLRKGHAMGVWDIQALGTDQAYHPSFDTYARSPPAGGGYSNLSECGIVSFSKSSYKRAVFMMHEDLNVLVTHGTQLGIDGALRRLRALGAQTLTQKLHYPPLLLFMTLIFASANLHLHRLLGTLLSHLMKVRVTKLLTLGAKLLAPIILRC